MSSKKDRNKKPEPVQQPVEQKPAKTHWVTYASPIISLVALLLAAGTAVVNYAWWGGRLDAKVGGLETALGELRADFRNLVRALYGPRAESLGIRPVSVELARFGSSFRIKGTNDGIVYDLIVDVSGVRGGRVILFLNGRIGTLVLEQSLLDLPVRAGEVTPIAPPLFVALLEPPRMDSVLLAIGPSNRCRRN